MAKPKRGRKKKVLPEFKIVEASKESPIIVKFD